VNLTELLEQSRKDVSDSIAGLSEPQAAAKPDPARWSILECIEHITAAEERFLGFLDQAGRAETPQVDPEKQARISAAVLDRTQRAQAPAPVQPASRFQTLAQALEAFQAARSRSFRFAEERAADLDILAAQHPRFGPVSAREFIFIIAGHARRHAAQIREIRASL
jgi:uncharacterized damage-inducible protein DinB